MINKIHELYQKIEVTELPKESEIFGGANLILTNDSNRKQKEQDIVVYSTDAKTLSWFVFQLKEVFKEDLDYFNKYSFYPYIGELLNIAINQKLGLRNQMLYVLENLDEFNEKIV